MVKNEYPVFNLNDTIEKKMFELLRDNPARILELQYKDYSDGILNGMDLSVDYEKKVIYIESGIFLHSGHIYWLDKKYSARIPENEGHYIVKLRINSKIKERKYLKREIEIITEKAEENTFEIKENELEITRYIWREGAELRQAYGKYEDLDREFNTLNIIYQKYASEHIDGTLNPFILQMWRKEAGEKENLDNYDIQFLFLSANKKIERENIIYYINRKLKKQAANYTNIELYKKLGEILSILGNDRNIPGPAAFRPNKIIVE